MARIIYTALVESIRGSIAGTTFQRNAYGYTVKKKPNMINPNTPDQQFQKTIFARAVRAWNQLTTAQRADWDTWASTYPQYAKNNPSSQLSGFAVFTKVHVYRFMTERVVKTNPEYTQYAQDTIDVNVTLAAGVLRLDIDSVLESEEWWCLFFISRPFSDAQNFVGSKPKFVYYSTNVSDTPDITTVYTNKYGSLPSIGQKLAVDLQMYGEENGQVLARESFIVTVVAP